MANGYIGKISALVTASTADLSRKLQGSAKDVDRFANGIRSQIGSASRSAQASLSGIFTPLQKLERALKAASGQLNILKPGQAAEVRAFVSAAEGINRPLEAAQKQFSGLSAEVASRFIPALNRAQEAALRVNDQISRTGIVTAQNFREAQRAVEAFAQSQARLAQIDRAASGGRTGREAEFVSPRALQTLREAAALSERASQMSPAALQDGGVARQVQRLQTFRNAIAGTVAEIEEIRLQPQVDSTALAAAERRLDNIVETTRQAQQELEQIVNRGADAQRRAEAASRFLVVDQRESQLTSLAGQATTRDGSGRTLQERAAAINSLNEQSQAEAALRAEQERRIAVANTLLPIDQRESQLTSLAGLATTRDTSGRTIQERVAAIDSLNQQAQAEASLRAEQEARLAVANSLLQVNQRESQLTSLAGRATALPAGFSEGRGRGRVQGLTGSLNLDSTPPPAGGFSEQATRDIDALATRVGGVRQQLETLPNSIRTRFVPELQRAQAQLVRLQNSPAATVQAIENATQRVQRLEAAARRASAAFDFRQSFGGPGLRGIEEGLNQQALGGYTAQLQILQLTLAGTSQVARGPAVAAFNNLRNAIADAMDSRTLGTEQTRRVIQQLTQDAVRATAAAAGIGARGLAQRLQRAGDIGRGAFGGVGLAIQQAAFAFDDFFSVTGDIDQRIRAAGNNISQLGFIIGGTWGLIGGIVLSVGAQAAAALVNWYNEGVRASDSTKALNDALARQKSLVEELAQAFKSLGDDLARRLFSAPAKQARDFAKQIDEITKKQNKINDSRLADLDPDVQRARATQNRIDRELEDESNPGRRIALVRERQQAVRDEREAARRAASAGVTDVSRIDLGRLSEFQRRRLDEVGGRPAARDLQGLPLAIQNIERLAAERALLGIPGRPAGTIRPREAIEAGAAAVRGVDASDALAVRALVRRQIEEASQIASGTGGFFGDPQVDLAREQLPALQRLLEQLESPTRRALAELEIGILRASNAAAYSIESAQEDVADAIRRGVKGAAEFQAALDESARQIAEANKAIEAASEIENPEEREAAVRRAQGSVREVQQRQAAINEAAREVRLGRGFGGRRTESALSALEGNERFVNEQARLTARVAAAVDAELQARRNLEAAIASGDQAAQGLARRELEAAQAAGDLAAAAAEAALSLEQAFARVRKTADNFLSASEGLADDAQRRLDEAATTGPVRDQLARERDEAERQLIRDRRSSSELQARLDRQRSEAASDPRVMAIDARLEQLRSQQEDAVARARIDGVQEPPAVAQWDANEEARLIAQREEIVRQSTAGTQRLIDEENRLIAARRAAAEQAQKQRDFEADIERRRNGGGAFENADAARGLGLIDTPAQKAAGELRQNLADIDRAVQAAGEAAIAAVQAAPNEDFKRRAREELEKFQGEANAARKRVIEEAFRAAAPAIFGLADQVQNAVLQGPSRAALQATDVSTVEGSRELNRLLRGDDSARDQNLVELQKQSGILTDMLQEIRQGGADIAN